MFKLQRLPSVSLILLLATALVLAGCAASHSGRAYSRYTVRQEQTVQMGVVDSVRQVLIEGTKTPIGAAAGAGIGGVAASGIGGGRGRTIATIGGALLGGLAGAAAEEHLTQRQGLEITVRLESGRYVAVVQEADEAFFPGDRVRVITAYNGTTRIAH